MRYFLLLGLGLLLLSSCDPDRVYEQNYDLAGNQWYIDTIPTFRFTVQDTAQRYDIFYLIRNAAQYPYYNLYVTYYLEDSLGNEIQSSLQELILMDPKTGRPRGDGLGSIFDHQIKALDNVAFQTPGTYTFRVKQFMRQDPLPYVMSVGVRVERNAGN
jgi:gliding motility-associated lipoprotein GldH